MGRSSGDRGSSEFQELLREFDLEHLDRHEHAVFGLTRDLTLGYMNPAWFRFADENGGGDLRERFGLGVSVLDATHESIRDFFEEHYKRCLQRGETWRHDYECSSAELQRRFHMHVYPISNGRGLVVVNSLILAEAHDPEARPAMPPIEKRYLDDDGFIRQCVHCRRVQRTDGDGQWDWVPAFVEEIPDHATGGLCETCFNVYYPLAPKSG